MRVTRMNAFTSPSHNHKRTTATLPAQPVVPVQTAQTEKQNTFSIDGLLGKLKTDDYILLGLLAVLIFEGCDDYILLAALGYLFVMGIV